jgi:Tol biopolymer transport system component
MAPEQATGEAVDARSDVFSFGAMLYEMVTGQRAFAGTSTADTLSAVIRVQPKAPSAIRSDVPSDLEKLILRCLRKDPQRRVQHMDDVKIALQDIKEESDSGVESHAPIARTRRNRRLVTLGASVLLVSAVTAWGLRSRRPPEAPAMRVMSVTRLIGREIQPTFSPDGEQVAFAWDGEKQDNWDIYVTLVGSSDVRRLTTDPAADTHPKWSPDGRQIAFLRERADGTTIQVVSPLGGVDRKLGDFRGADSIDWSPDGRWLAAGREQENGAAGEPPGIYLISFEGNEPRPLIASGPYMQFPAFSPDGHQLAYASCSGLELRCDVYLVELNAARSPSAPPQSRRLTTQGSLLVRSIAWTRDGRALVYGAAAPGERMYLWRVGADAARAPERIETAGPDASGPAIARSRDRLAFARYLTSGHISRFEVGRPVQLLVESTAGEGDPSLSADGQRLVFASSRSGDTEEIWTAGADGSNPQQLTHGPGRAQGSPHWSPDGRRIAFDSLTADGHWGIWIIDADGGSPRRLTALAGDENVPIWSRDGRWIYLSSNRGTARDIWRVSASGGTPERLTRGGSGSFVCETADAKELLFQPKDADSALMMMPLTGGAARQLVPCVRNSAFGLGPQGVYYVPCGPASDPIVHVMDLHTGRDHHLGTLEGLRDRPLGLSVSPDGKTIVYQSHSGGAADLMLIENFR